MMKIIVLLSLIGYISCITHYDAFTGTEVSESDYLANAAANSLYASWCVKNISLPCDSTARSRLDGSCNNLDLPISGMGREKFYRILPSTFGPGWYNPRLAKNGSSLPLGRKVRTEVLPEGRVPDKRFTHNLPNVWVTAVTDVASGHDTFNYVLYKTEGCTPEEVNDPMYASNTVPRDDPVLRFSGTTCTNMTRPISYQTQGCTNNYTSPERLNTATAAFDASWLYGMVEGVGRSYQNGLFNTSTDQYGRVWPPTTNSTDAICIQNNYPDEAQCLVVPNDVMNTLPGIIVTGIWFYRQHNGIATELLKQNPTWDDEKLFSYARNINIAIYLQTLLYELLPSLLGKQNLIDAGVILEDGGFRDIYDDTSFPQVAIEYTAAMRWGHVMQEGKIKLNTNNGTRYAEMPLMNLTLHSGYFLKDRNMEGVTQGFFREGCGSTDYVVDPDVANLGLGAMQRALDLCTNDLMKHRYFGFQPYVNYLAHYSGKNYTDWDDLLEFIDKERVLALQDVYNDIEDIDLMAGLWLEKPISGGYAPTTLFNIIATQFGISIKADRHWYENSQRPNAFTADQLKEIRKATLSYTICNYGDSVTEIQANAYETISEANPLVSCDAIPQIDFSAWKESETTTTSTTAATAATTKTSNARRRRAPRKL